MLATISPVIPELFPHSSQSQASRAQEKPDVLLQSAVRNSVGLITGLFFPFP